MTHSCNLAAATYRVRVVGHITGGLAAATYRVPLGGHISGSLAAATYRVAVVEHILAGLAAATYRVPLGGHISGGLAAATYRVYVDTFRVVWPPQPRGPLLGDTFLAAGSLLRVMHARLRRDIAAGTFCP